jgi:SAM-dependent methyltransferase
MRNIDLEKEREYENLKVESDGMIRSSQSKYYWSVEPEIAAFDNLVCKHALGNEMLEVGCSDGTSALNYCNFASIYRGVDISNLAIDVAKSRGIENAFFDEADAHKLPFGDGSFDLVVVNSLLHHLDLEVALDEIKRVLKSDGVFLLREPLGTNPLFNLYRKVTPAARTPDEKPFDRDDLHLIRRKFAIEDKYEFGFFVVFAAFFRVRALRALLGKVDKFLSKVGLGPLFWQVVIVARAVDEA